MILRGMKFLNEISKCLRKIPREPLVRGTNSIPPDTARIDQFGKVGPITVGGDILAMFTKINIPRKSNHSSCCYINNVGVYLAGDESYQSSHVIINDGLV